MQVTRSLQWVLAVILWLAWVRVLFQGVGPYTFARAMAISTVCGVGVAIIEGVRRVIL
jgi:hypothetical protein